jgi:hypothetical protein
MPQITCEELVRRLTSVKLQAQQTLELIGYGGDVSERERLLSLAPHELMLVLRELDGKEP